MSVALTESPDELLSEAISAHQQGDLEKALAAYQQIMGLDPEHANAMIVAAAVHADKGETDAAEWLLRRSLKIAPTCLAYNTLGVILLQRRKYDEGINAYRASIALDPGNTTTWPNLLFALDMHPQATPALKLAERRRFNELHCRALTEAAAPHTNDPDPERRLRVGYVSGDFKQHSAAHGFTPVLAGHHRRQQVTLYLYDVDQAKPNPDDKVTDWIKSLAHVWRDARVLSDESLADMIRADQIDILVDLSGYSGGGRTLMFARRPAPIQITGYGYGTGTGIDAMDYLVSDEVSIPYYQANRYHEQILRLPILMGYTPIPNPPDVGPAPRDRNGFVTFGYGGRASKLSPQTLSAWAEILTQVPTSRLLCKGGEFDDASQRTAIWATLEALGVHPGRVEFRGGGPTREHLAFYGDVDIALDTFPHGGGITTVETTLMGVPTITMFGAYVTGRTSAAILSLLGFTAAIAKTPMEYVSNAVETANVEWTQEDRLALRIRLSSSIMLDANRYAAAAEDAYRSVWQTWCQERAS